MHVYIVLLVVLGLVGWFAVRFVKPAFELEKTLKNVTSKIQGISPGTPPSQVQQIFEEDPDLEKIWKEFVKTLHQQKGFQDGEYKTIGVFATVTSDAYSTQKIFLRAAFRVSFLSTYLGS